MFDSRIYALRAARFRESAEAARYARVYGFAWAQECDVRADEPLLPSGARWEVADLIASLRAEWVKRGD